MAIRSRGTNNRKVGYSEEALAALERGKYDQLTGRDPKYRTSQQQTQQVKELPKLKSMANAVNAPQTTKPSTRYENQNVLKSTPKISTRDTKFDKDLDELWNYRFGDFSGEVDYDPVMDVEQPHWQTLREQIKRKNKWTDDELDTRFKAYDDERLGKMADQEVKTAKDIAKKSGLAGTLLQALYTPQNMIEGGAAMLSNLAPDKYKAQSADDTLFTGTRAKEGIKQTVKDEHIKSGLGKGAYDIGTSVGDMLMSAGIPILGTASLGAQAAARSNMQALERGVDPKKAALTGATSGVISGVLNKVGLDKALGKTGKTAVDAIKKAALTEGLENVTEDAANIAIDKFINKDKSQQNALYDYYKAQGMSDADAKKQVTKDTAGDLITSALSGAAFGGAMSGLKNLPALRGLLGNKTETGIPEVDNAIKQTNDATAKIQELSEQIPKTENADSISSIANQLTDDLTIAKKQAENNQFGVKHLDELKENDARVSLDKRGKLTKVLEENPHIKRNIEGVRKTPEIINTEINNLRSQIDNYQHGLMKENESFDCGETPAVLKESGVKGNRIMADQSIFDKITIPEGFVKNKKGVHYHGLDKDGFEKIIIGLNDPAVTLKLKNRKGEDAVNAIINYTSKNGHPVLVAVTLGEDGTISNISDIAGASKVMTAHIRGGLDNYIESNAKNIKYIKGDDGSDSNALWFDALKSSSPFDNNVTPTGENVNKVMNESAPRNPRLVQKLEGEERAKVETERAQVKTRKKVLNGEINDLKKKAKNGKLTKAEQAELKKLNAEKNKLDQQDKDLGYRLDGKAKPFKEILKGENYKAYNDLYGTKMNTATGEMGTFGKIDNVVKFAGKTDEAVALGKQIKQGIENYIESGGKTKLFDEIQEAANRLDALAKENDNIPFGDKKYVDRLAAIYGSNPETASIWDFLTNDINDAGEAIRELDSKYAIPEETSAMDELSALNEGRVPTEAPENNVPNLDGMMPGDIPPAETTPANGEEKIRSFSRRGSEDTSLPDDIRAELKEDTYRVVRNADTQARADELFDENNLTQTRSNLEQAVKNHDPAAAPLSYRLAKAYIDAGDYDAATDVIESVSAELTRGGQFTQAAKLAMMQNDPMAALRAYKKDLQNINQWGKEKYGKKWNKLELSQEDMDLFNSVSKGDKEGLNKVVSQLNTKFGKQVPSTLWDKLVATSKTSMLLNLRTQGRNIISNAAVLPVRSLSDRVSAVGQNIAHLINPDVKVTQSLTGGSREQKEIAKEIFNNLKDSIVGENKMKDSTKSDILSNRQIFNDDFLGRFIDNHTNGGLQKLNEKLGGNANKSTMETLSNFTYWLMGDFGDTPFVRKNFVNRLASYMKAQGINNIDDVPDDAIAIATEEALKATFKDDNAFSTNLAGIKKKSGKFGEIALPFVKTPANLAMRGIDYSPAGLINTFKKIRSGADANKVIDELAKNLTGTAMIFLGYKLREKGILSGNYSDDKDEKAWQKQQGMLENAVHVGDNYYTFDWAQPSSTPLIIGSVLFDATNNSDEENNGLLKAINSGKDAAVAVGNSWISTSPLQSLSDIMGGGEYNNDGGVAGNVLNEVIEFPQRFIPAQLGATARTIDPVIRDTYSNDSTLTGTLGNQVRALQSRIPQLSKKLPASYDTWGNERTRSDTKGEAFFAQNINPGQLGNKNETPLDAEITRIYEATGNKEVFPLSAARSLNLGNDGNIKLTNKQHSDYQKMLGQRSYKLAEELMNNKDFKALSDDEKAATLKKAYDLSNALAKEELFDYVTDNDGKLKAAYKEKGEKGAVEHLIDSAKATQLGLDVDTYQKKQAEYKGGAEQYAADKKKADALGLTVDTYNKKQSEYQGGAAQYAKDKQNAISGGFTDKDGNANMDAYEDAVEIFGNNQSKLSNYQSFRAKGYTKDAQKVPELMNNNSFTAEEKGKILRGTDPSKLGKAAKGMYDLGGYEGVYYYYLMKNLADTNQNGSVTKAERAALLNSDNQYVMQIPDDMYYYLGKNLK